MIQSNIGANIRTLRDRRQVTQEQLAQALHLSTQAVSKWENQATVPDAMMLPLIAGFFDVTIDELFRQNPNPYANRAQQLLSLYESSHDRNDFIRADAEYRKLFDSGKYTREDIRAYGVLNEFQMYDCLRLALEHYDSLLAGPERDDVYQKAQTQRITMLSRIGRGEEAIREAERQLEAEPHDPENRLALMAALYWNGRYAEVLQQFQAAGPAYGVRETSFCLYAGDACSGLERYEEAFQYWNRAFELEPEFADPLYSMAEAYHAQGLYREEAAAWEQVIDWLLQRGYTLETGYPKERLKKVQERLRAGE